MQQTKPCGNVSYMAADHGGVTLKGILAAHLSKRGFTVRDLGTDATDSCDYPPLAQRLCREVLHNGACGVLICGTGIGMSITANRFPGIRAALCTHEFHAKATRAHNNANVLCLGERVTAPALACDLADIFLSTPFEGGRHQRRIDQIDV